MVSNGPLRNSGGLRAREPGWRRDILLSAMVQSSKAGVSIVIDEVITGYLEAHLDLSSPVTAKPDVVTFFRVKFEEREKVLSILSLE